MRNLSDDEQVQAQIAELEKSALTAIRSIRELAQQHPDASHKAASTLTHVATIAQVEQNAAWKVAQATMVRRVPVEDIPW